MASALGRPSGCPAASVAENAGSWVRSEEHTSELQSQSNLVCRLLLEKKKKRNNYHCDLEHDDSPAIATDRYLNRTRHLCAQDRDDCKSHCSYPLEYLTSRTRDDGSY